MGGGREGGRGGVGKVEERGEKNVVDGNGREWEVKAKCEKLGCRRQVGGEMGVGGEPLLSKVNVNMVRQTRDEVTPVGLGVTQWERGCWRGPNWYFGVWHRRKGG